MQINNTSPNLGSIQLTKEANKKGARTLSLEILENLKINILSGKTPDEIRQKLRPSTVNVLPNQETGAKITAKTLEEELSILERIKKDFDPEAQFINDFQTPTLDISG